MYANLANKLTRVVVGIKQSKPDSYSLKKKIISFILENKFFLPFPNYFLP